MVKIKICGITNKDDALGAANLGADMLGFVFYKGSKRFVKPETARDIIDFIPSSIAKVGVFVDQKTDEVLEIAEEAGLDILQFHGSESAGYCMYFSPRFKVMKAFRIKDRMSFKGMNKYNTDYYLFDTHVEGSAGGTGKSFDWNLLKDIHILKSFFVSGGLNASNVGKAIGEFTPYGVDASSSLEIAPGKKDMGLVKKFIEEVRRAA